MIMIVTNQPNRTNVQADLWGAPKSKRSSIPEFLTPQQCSGRRRACSTDRHGIYSTRNPIGVLNDALVHTQGCKWTSRP